MRPRGAKKSLYLQCKGLGSIFCKQGIFSSFFPDYSLNMLQLHRTILLYLMFLLDVNFQFEGYNQSSFIKYLVASVHICIFVDFIFGVSTHAFSAKMCCSFLGHLSFFFVCDTTFWQLELDFLFILITVVEYCTYPVTPQILVYLVCMVTVI